MNILQKNILLYARAGFGISFEDFNNPKPIDEVVESLFSKEKIEKINIIKKEELSRYFDKNEGMDEMTKNKLHLEFMDLRLKLYDRWMNELINTKNPLLEKMTLFWQGHFATYIKNIYFEQELLHTLRINALGNFGDLLRQVSKSFAMLLYLNNIYNSKEHPNENFSREVMELFTLGVGHYTETDIKEAARAFTGWGIDKETNFIEIDFLHDKNEKIFLGKKGNFNGDDILNIILEQKQTAIFITEKIYTFFVTDEKINTKIIEKLSTEFYNSNYNISLLLKNIFLSDWFYSSTIVGSKIKSPVELLVNYQKLIPYSFNGIYTQYTLQRTLGQQIFTPPNVAGWQGGKKWIDSFSLTLRMRLPEALLINKEIKLSVTDNTDEMNTEHIKPDIPLKLDNIKADWSNYLTFFKNIEKKDLPKKMAKLLITSPLTKTQIYDIERFAENQNIESYIIKLTILFMELPEYQLT